MRIEIDGRSDFAEATPDTPLGEVLDVIRRFAAEGGFSIGALRLDGQVLTPGIEAERRDTPTGRFALLEVLLDEPPATAAAGDPAVRIRAARERIERAAGLLARGKRREALTEIAAAAGDLLVALRGRGADPEALRDLKAILDRLNQAIASEDDVAAADQLAYELAPRLRSMEGTCSP